MCTGGTILVPKLNPSTSDIYFTSSQQANSKHSGSDESSSSENNLESPMIISDEFEQFISTVLDSIPIVENQD